MVRSARNGRTRCQQKGTTSPRRRQSSRILEADSGTCMRRSRAASPRTQPGILVAGRCRLASSPNLPLVHDPTSPRGPSIVSPGGVARPSGPLSLCSNAYFVPLLKSQVNQPITVTSLQRLERVVKNPDSSPITRSLNSSHRMYLSYRAGLRHKCDVRRAGA